MTQDKHTPGPWRYYRVKSQTGQNTKIVVRAEIPPNWRGDTVVPIAEIPYRRTGSKRGGHPNYLEHPQDEPNAALIASAPTFQSRIDRLKDELKANIIVMDAASTKIDRLEAEKVELVEALEELRDEQNGPPLIQYAERWQAAFDKANAVLSKHTPVSEQGAEPTNPKAEK